ncbi:unnamed protein product [Adineta steineri]|uniref:Saccharopine dehydrogenase n=1 Tax=Adineta steineri TaxID=433720 RepID=A0A815C3N3_9BILA|nr:unnamed protein product [Adineta steineri]CAF1563429.1 unnamed protein product [Adineta steineri]
MCLFVLIPITNGINCVSCVGWSNSGCNDPYDEATSGDLPVPGNTYCLKVVYPSYIERMAGGRSCTPGSGPDFQMKILIIGAYGTFGSRLSQLLANKSQLTLFIAGRSIKHAEQFCKTIDKNVAKILPLYFDRNDLEIEKRLKSIQPDIVIDATGPFQFYGNDPYHVVKACLATSTNYMDLADGTQFVKDINQFDSQAKSKNLFLLSGVSTCPVLTATVVRSLTKGLHEIHSIKGGIAPSPYVNIGPNVIRAITSYAGQPMSVVRHRQLIIRYGLTETMRYTISPPGYLPLKNRRFSLVDVPDYQILRDLWPNINSIWFGAGTIPESLHRLLNYFAWLVRLRLFPNLSSFSSIIQQVMNIIRWGEHRGGMFISIEGINNQGHIYERSWHLIAEGDIGPFIPTLGIDAIIHRILDGKIPISGARAATTDLELEDYDNLFKKLGIITGQRESINKTNTSLTLYQKLLDQAWHQLPYSLQRMHSYTTNTKVAGIAKVERGTSITSKLIAMLFRFPQAGQEIPVQVVFHPNIKGELWTRTFAGRSFSSWQMEGHGRSDKLLNERFGPFTFGLALVINSEKLYLIVQNWSFLGIPLPSFLAPNGISYEYDNNGQFCFNVEIKHRFTGLIVRYSGWLEKA